MKELKKEDIKVIFPKRDENSNTGNFGYVGIMGGCIEYSGAVKLANLSSSALTSGAGVVRLIVPKEIANGVMPYLLEQTLFTFESKDGHMIFDKDKIDKSLEKLKAIAIGMGWGESCDNEKILSYILETKDIPVVIDADGLNTLAKMDKSILNKLHIHENIGLIVSGDQFVGTQQQVDLIKKHFPEALCSEMEAAAVGHVCFQFHTPFIITRSLSDVFGKGQSSMQFDEYLKIASENSAQLCVELIQG